MQGKTILLLAACAAVSAAAEPPNPIVRPTERQQLYLATFEKMRAIAKPVDRIAGPASRVRIGLDREAPGYRGQITPFWRTRVVPDRWLSPPSWALKSDDPVIGLLEGFTGRNLAAFPRASLLDDTVSCVRLLGGWKAVARAGGEVDGDAPIQDYDLVFRGADGALHYRWERLHRRLDPIVENGLEPFIVLDNVPYCLSDGDGQSQYGQHRAPNDFEAWGAFVEALCRELADRYGFERANAWRFRVGTEMDNPNHWEGGAPDSLEKYLKTYDFAAAAVKRALPGAKVGPCNWNSMFAGQIDRKVPPPAAFAHFASGTNHATGAIGSPVDFASVSSYGLYWMGGRFDHPDAARHGLSPDVLRLHADLLKRLRAASPRFDGISLEVHEHGALFNKDEAISGEPGAFGAAWTATQYIVGIDEGLSHIFHWAEYDRVGGRLLLHGHAWLRAVFEKLVGGEAWVAPVANATADSFLDALAVRKDGKLYLLLSAYDPEPGDAGLAEVEILLPREFARAAVRQLALSRANAPYDEMHRDLAAAGQARGGVNAVGHMASPEGRALLDANAEKYARMQEESFAWKPFEGSLGRRFLRGAVLKASLPVPSVTVLVLEP